MSESLPPPIYSRTDPDESPPTLQENISREPEILIVPTGHAVNFQKGFLGADGETAAIEGELQIKGTGQDRWSKVTVTLRTVETVDDQEVELGSSEVVLLSVACADPAPCYSSLPFAIPLTPDTPQSIKTSHSSLSHHLTATLYPFDAALPPISRTLTVHTKRYTSHSHTLLVTPEIFRLDRPSGVEIEIPRATFQVGESIPVYVTVPPPPREVVINEGWRLRNVRVELVRLVKIRHNFDQGSDMPAWQDDIFEEDAAKDASTGDGPSTIRPDLFPQPSSSKVSPLHLYSDSTLGTTIGRSGASCRFHSSRPVRLRFVLHQSSCSPYDIPINILNGDHRFQDNDADCPSITQLTVLHSITFQLAINVAFLNVITRRERISAISIPITIIAPPAPLPEVSPEIDVAYQKKHDKPPMKTVRQDEVDHPAPNYSEGEAGPSGLPPNSAPPPFEEQDAPPPFWLNECRASTSTRLPSFLESESEIIIPEVDQEVLHPLLPDPIITGEGSEFGFLSSEQFDGHSEPLQREFSPPPSLEMAARDTDVTSLADISEPQLAIETLGLVIDSDEAVGDAPSSPPPPPAMDDPSDPPPCIDTDFSTRDMPLQSLATATTPASTLASDELLRPASDRSQLIESTDGHAPPPYLNPGHQENVARPPPYVD